MPTEARGNYLPEAPYLRETKTYLNCNSHMQCMGTSNIYDYQHNTTISVQFSSSLSQLQWHMSQFRPRPRGTSNIIVSLSLDSGARVSG